MGALKQSWHKIRALRPGRIGDEAQRPFFLEIVAPTDSERQALSRVFVSDELAPEARELALSHIASRAEMPPAAGHLQVRSPQAPGSGTVVDWQHPDPGLLALLRAHPDYQLALGRAFPVLRELLARELIQAVAGRNAAVAALSALPDVIPNPLSLLLALGEVGSDTIIITGNQIALCFELAALRGDPVGWLDQAGSITAILAGALGWRSLARELVGFIPAGIGVAAKAGIAYSGTLTVGSALWRFPKRSRTKYLPAAVIQRRA